MARPRKKLFYEDTMLGNIPGQEWLVAFDSNSHQVVEYLVGKGVGNTIYYSTIKCLEKLRNYLLQKGMRYSAQKARQWYENGGPYPKGYQTALYRLQDIYDYGVIQPVNAFPVAFPYYQSLIGLWKQELDDYLDTLDNKTATLTQVRNCISRFLYCIQEQGITHPSELSFDLIEQYVEMDRHRSDTSEARYTYSIGDILIFMADKGLCSHGIGWYPYFRRHGKILHMSQLTESQISSIEALRLESLEFPAGEFAGLIPDFMGRFQSSGYSESPCAVARTTLYGLLTFLEMNGLGYHPDIAVIWLQHEMLSYKNDGWKQLRRILDLFEVYTREGDVAPEIIFRKKPLFCEKLPAWCKDELNDFLGQKTKEGWEHSTLCMYRSAVTRFCEFLVCKELHSFSDVTPDLIKTFNQTDPHLTAEGKNAYNVRIRKFLQFLGRKSILPYGLHQALCCTSAKKEHIAVTLSDEEKAEISRKHRISESPIELRNRAIMLLGMNMGIRASDIVKIKLQDINWSRQTIKILQKKTSHEIELPMPTNVGNAVYLYIKDGRSQTECQSVFVKSRVPFNSLKRNVCLHALKATLPERRCTGSGFHVTRKTFATDQICNEVGRYAIADMLGHRDTSSLFHYLNLDPERMLMCPLSLSETELALKGGRYD